MNMQDIVKKIKFSTLAIGLIKRNDVKPFAIYGSGFIVDNDGLVTTAEHVFDACKQVKKSLKNSRNIDVDYAVFRVAHDEKGLSVDTAVVSNLKKITFGKKDPLFPLNRIDLGFGKMLSPIPDCVPLEISKEKSQIFDEVAISGYPSGDYSFDVDRRYTGLRLSPIFQSGRITGFLPFDDAPEPYGIQLDIIGVGGSSGSPIFNLKSGKIVGMAQQVLPASVQVNVGNDPDQSITGYGLAKVGQVLGVSNGVLFDIVEGVKKFYRDGKIEDFAIHSTALDFSIDHSVTVKVDKSELE